MPSLSRLPAARSGVPANECTELQTHPQKAVAVVASPYAPPVQLQTAVHRFVLSNRLRPALPDGRPAPRQVYQVCKGWQPTGPLHILWPTNTIPSHLRGWQPTGPRHILWLASIVPRSRDATP